MNEDERLLDDLVALRPSQGDLVALSLHDSVRRDLLGASVGPFCLGRFTVLERLGTGGMGVVFVAYDPDLDRKIALKVLHARGEQGRTEALREGRALARLKHPNVVAVYEAGVLDGHVFVAMEYIPGRDLRAWLRGAPSRGAILERLIEAGQGLAAAHDQGLIHRDFKPENVVIDAAGHARVIDFGLARPLDELAPSDHEADVPAEARPSLHGGTRAYMAPERQDGSPGDARADQYSFCLACWEALFGQRRVDNAPPTAGVPARIVRALRRGLSHAPADRFPSMRALLAVLADRPARRWTRRMLVAVAVCVALGGYTIGRRARTELPCVSPWEQLAGTWSTARAEAIGAAFAETGEPFARRSWATAHAAIDRWTDAWIGTHARACHETAVLGIAPRELYGRRLLCLENRRIQFAALLDRFAAADRQTVTEALTAVDRLPVIVTCEQPDGSDLLPAGEPAQVQDRLAIREELARARSQLIVGRFADAQAQLERVVSRARHGDDPGLLAEALVAVGRADSFAGRVDAAIARTRQALRYSLEQPYPLIAAQAVISLVGLHGERRDGGTAIDDLLLAAEALTRLAGDPPQLRLELLMVRGTARRHANRWTEALADQTAARALALELDVPHLAAIALGNAGNYHEALGDYDAAEAALEQGLTELRSVSGELHPSLAVAHNNLANLAIARDREEEAILHLERGAAIIRANFGEVHPMMAVAHLHLGTLHSTRHQHAAALAEHRAARALFEQVRGPRHPLTALAMCAVGFELHQLGDLEAARVELEKSAAVQAESLPPTDCDRLQCAGMRGELLRSLRRPQDAVTLLEPLLAHVRASSCASRLGGDVELQLAWALWELRGMRERSRIRELLDAVEPWLAESTRERAEQLRLSVR